MNAYPNGPYLVILNDDYHEAGNPTCFVAPDRKTALAVIKAHALSLFEEGDPEGEAALELTEYPDGSIRAVADYTGYAQPWSTSPVPVATNDLRLCWQDGEDGRDGPERVTVTLRPDQYGVTLEFYDASGGRIEAEVLVEFYAGVVQAHVWNDKDYGGDPTATVELFKVVGGAACPTL